jgi:Nucleoside-diphosphate-sugar epimerases
MNRILVTGGAGFIGSHLCERLLADGNEVICLDNFFTGRKENLNGLLDSHQFELVRHDVTEPILLEVDQIYNLACPASPIHYQYNPVKTVKTNVMGMINMLGLAKRVHARILQASTSEVYGDPLVHPQTEDYWGNVNTIGIRSCYDEGKRVAETLMMDYHRQNGVDTRIARFLTPTASECSRTTACRIKFHRSGASRRRSDHLWRGHADTFVLLRQRPRRRIDPANECRGG